MYVYRVKFVVTIHQITLILKDNYSCSKRILIQIESRFKETCMSISMLRNISLYFHFLTRILSVRFHCFGFLKVFQSLSQVEYVSNCAFCERKIQLALINSFFRMKGLWLVSFTPLFILFFILVQTMPARTLFFRRNILLLITKT